MSVEEISRPLRSNETSPRDGAERTQDIKRVAPSVPNLSGMWKLQGENVHADNAFQIRHWSFCNALWSVGGIHGGSDLLAVLSPPISSTGSATTPDTEGPAGAIWTGTLHTWYNSDSFTGHVFVGSEDQALAVARFGDSADHGQTSHDLNLGIGRPTLTIAWPNGSIWHRIAEESPWPSLRAAPHSALMCAQSLWTSCLSGSSELRQLCELILLTLLAAAPLIILQVVGFEYIWTRVCSGMGQELQHTCHKFNGSEPMEVCGSTCYEAVIHLDPCSTVQSSTWNETCPNYLAPSGFESSASIKDLCPKTHAEIARCCWTCKDELWHARFKWHCDIWTYIFLSLVIWLIFPTKIGLRSPLLEPIRFYSCMLAALGLAPVCRGPAVRHDDTVLKWSVHFDAPPWQQFAYFVIVILAIVVIRRTNRETNEAPKWHAESDPATWHRISKADSDVAQEISDEFALNCRKFWSPFSLEVKKVYCIDASEDVQQNFAHALGPDMASDTEGEQPDLRRNISYSGTKRLYHGTSSWAAQAIADQGFRLPTSSYHLMFGKGIYFSDLPQKAWCFAGECEFEVEPTEDRRYMLLCDVALGKAKRMKAAADGGELIKQVSFGGTAYDSVVGLDESEGGVLTMREYAVFNPSQTLPRFLIAVTATTTGYARPAVVDVAIQAADSHSMSISEMPLHA